MAHIIDEKEQPMSNFGTTQGPNKRYRRLRHPAFTADTWTSANPLLQKGEIGIETDTYKMKAGDGVTYWNDLPYTFDDVGANIDLSNLSATGKANVSAQGTYNEANTYSAGTVGKALQDKLNLDGTNTMTGVLKMRASVSFQCAIAPYWDGVGFYKLNDNDSVTLMASIESTQGFLPAGTNVYNIGSSDHKWKDLYLAGKAYIATINNGGDIAVPTTSGTLGLNDFSNITDSAKNIANWSNNVTNCITYIPQDINLELSAGTLTLISGSKLYLPNGVGVFDDYSTTQNYNITQTNNGTYLVFFNGSSIFTRDINKCFSGTEPSTVQTYSAWYDTANNLIKYTTNSTTWQTGMYLPIAQVTVSDGAISSIDQVFNGFGYIGSTVFALPGVKSLIPNGFNADGTLNNTVATQTKVRTYTNGAGRYNALIALDSSTNNEVGRVNNFISSDDLSLVNSSTVVYSPSRNLNFIDVGSGITKWPWGAVGHWDATTSSITAIRPYNALHAVDYSDTDFIAHQAMPGKRYINLTFPANPGGDVTMSADGYLWVSKTPTSAGQYVKFTNNSNGITVGATSIGTEVQRLILPVSKGDVISVESTLGGSTNNFRLVSPNGAK